MPTGGPTSPLPHANDGDATFQPFGRNCAEGGQQEATGGTVIYTVVTDTLMAASYDLLFGKSRVLGSFSAPTYVLCARARRRGCASSSGKVKVISPMGANAKPRPGARTERPGG